jgi:hypothetical protein
MSGVNQETESADDFVLGSGTRLNSATFTGLIPAGSSANQVIVEIYRVFPNDSDTARTPNVPTGSTLHRMWNLGRLATARWVR